ncbi:hypothetical protein OHT76_06685 [Streptomyces sp. NBC_00287]|uniref:hypothetical protein n=1 Tax=Streptomyces sp. NBC_00287 TaxID=2975702 RepID=UPI002E298FB1|nr:hypothetical protein [Streptomyces sp. NBC_00287]
MADLAVVVPGDQARTASVTGLQGLVDEPPGPQLPQLYNTVLGRADQNRGLRSDVP